MKNKDTAVTSDRYKQYKLHSAFQPIISIPHRRPVGYEGLIRAHTDEGEQCSPFDLFMQPKSSEEHLELDRICRRLHMANYSRQNADTEWLFINLDSQCLAEEKPKPGFMDGLFSLHNISPHRVVIEILESEISDRDYLKSLILHFRSMGCLIAIDDFGAGHSNFERIWELEPDIVKVDRRLVERAANSAKVKRILSGMVSLIHQAGSLVIIEGVETEKEADVAIAVNADMVQGFYFARPNAIIQQQNEQVDNAISRLIQLQLERKGEKSNTFSKQFPQFKKLFKDTLHNFSELSQFELCANKILSEAKSVRCFLLDEAGNQIGDSRYSSGSKRHLDERFTPLLSGEYANWSHKHYHHHAISSPGRIQMTRPYLSIAGSQMCITISKAVKIDGKLFVFCCDLNWKDDYDS